VRGAGTTTGLAVLAAGAVLAAATQTLADDHPITLHWRAPTGCPEQAAVRRRVDELIAGASLGRPLVADVAVTGGDDRYHVDMRLTDEAGRGERRLDASTCEELAEATALIVALAYAPETVAANRAHAEEGGGSSDDGRDASAGDQGGGPTENILPLPPVMPAPPVPPAAPSPRFTGPARMPPPPPRVASTRFTIAPLIGVELGALPDPATLLGGEVALRLDPFEIRARGTYALPVRETLPTRDAGGDFDRWTVGPAICLAPWRTRRATEGAFGGLRLGTCLGLELGSMRGRGFGVRNPDEGSALWLAPDAEGHLGLTLFRWLELDLALAAVIPLRRPEFVLEQVGIVHRASAITGRTTAGVTVTLP